MNCQKNNTVHITKTQNKQDVYLFLLENELNKKSNKNNKKLWNDRLKKEVSKEIKIISEKLNLKYTDILKLITIESNWNYGAVSKKNRDGSRDFGLTQINSRYSNYRCKKVFNKKCTKKDLLNPIKSLKIMEVVLKECSNNKSYWVYVCYNNPKNALNKKNYYWK